MRKENEHCLAVNPNVVTYVEEKRARVHSRRGRDCAQAWTGRCVLDVRGVLSEASTAADGVQ